MVSSQLTGSSLMTSILLMTSHLLVPGTQGSGPVVATPVGASWEHSVGVLGPPEPRRRLPW